MGTKVRDVMTDRPRCVTPDTPLNQVAELMDAENVGSIPILEGEQVTGVVTDRDIVVRAVAKGKDPRGMPVREIASGDLVTVNEDHDLSDALDLMTAHQVRRLPVVDEGNRLVGIVAQADIAMQAKEKDVGEMLQGISQPERGPRL